MMASDQSIEQIAFKLILYAGNAKSSLMEAMYLAREGSFKEAREKIAVAKGELSKAHLAQTSLIQSEARGEKSSLSILLVHSQDHLMNAMLMRDLVEEIIFLHEKIKNT
ncbi:PTS lactose/cellobiose transporter subunit IIA [Bacillus sp. RG28]|uniref:PTS lactose/cellobiose transporter subunit IIA n=2 Tax=Gottfriedia endophytica TaxID=2820819 RepID=A0A940NSM6_9BACI|nr:PTS lactose/cellobiose transporter subunit IIA [Gottfriedia endophytica]MBP0726803.1 PTS lactose/cellobiose transporter subunit IIA [Gottfriedia endophytica]